MEIQSEINTVQEFVAKGNFHAAMNIAISAMNECRRNADQAGTDVFIGIIRDVVNTMAEQFGSKSV